MRTLGLAIIDPKDDAASGFAFCAVLGFASVIFERASGLFVLEMTGPWTLTWFRGSEARRAASVAGNGGFCFGSGASMAIS